MSSPIANLRLFVAIHPPADAVTSLLAMLEEMKLPAHRPTPPEQVHLTLHFIGDTPVTELKSRIESVARSTSGLSSFSLQVRRLIMLPERGPRRLVAAETDRPVTLLELQRRLATRLARTARRKPGDRFRPHLTLCRFRSPARIESLDHALAETGFLVDRLTLLRSTLHPDGARHHEVETFPLNS